MKNFLLQTLIFLIASAIPIYFVLNCAGGNTDPYYLRFTTPRKNSLIIGTSRSAQAIRPDILNKLLARNDLFNFSFTVSSSSYGPIYYENIKKKLVKNSHNGIFILEVNPWNISNKSDNPNEIEKFPENEMALGKTYFTNLNPNVQYLFDNYNRSFFNLLSKKKGNLFLHEDGWDELIVELDSLTRTKRTVIKIREYKEINLKKYKFSTVRMFYLKEIIKYLKEHGEVYLVRLPIHPKMQEVEDLLMNDFNKKIKSISSEFNIHYLDMTNKNNEYEYSDGTHIYKSSTEEVSKEISAWILSLKKNELNTK